MPKSQPVGKPSSFSEQLRKARKAAGLSQAQLGEEFGVGQTTVARWEKGRAIPQKHLRGVTEWVHRNADELVHSGLVYGADLIELAKLARDHPREAVVVIREAVRMLKQGINYA